MNGAIVLAFQALMLGVDALCLIVLARFRRSTVAMGVPFALLTAGAVLAFLLAGEPFGAMHLVSYALFLHLPLVLLAGGYLIGRQLWHWRLLAWTSAVGIAIIGVDAFFIEPTWLEVTTYEIKSTKVSRPHRIALLADLQTDRIGNYEHSVLGQVRELQPDVILLAGDYLQVPASVLPELQRQFAAMWRDIPLQPALGTVAVTGNVDPPGWQTAFAALPVTVLASTASHTCGELHVTGLSLRDSFDPRLRVAPELTFHVVLGHGPDFALSDQVEADLLLAGHTHGGQVRLPGIGPLLTLSQVPRAWASGRTELPRGRTLIVSRGIGLERGTAPRLRFLCRPQLVVIDVLPMAER